MRLQCLRIKVIHGANSRLFLVMLVLAVGTVTARSCGAAPAAFVPTAAMAVFVCGAMG